MAYVAPTITAAGLTIPTYADIRDELITQAQTIFGADIYIGEDSQDYQYISVVSQKVYDAFLTAQLVFNANSPSTAIGSNLDKIVKVNGISRIPATYSTATVTLTGTTGTVITGGVVQDITGQLWNLTSPVTIGGGGTVTTTATCQTAGAIVAQATDISIIYTPTAGWTAVSNPSAAVTGTNVEADYTLRARQATSTAQPSQSVLEGTTGAVAAIPGVTRYQVYENDTGSTNSDGQPAHSIAAVVEGGTDANIGTAILNHKTIGCLTHGTTAVTVTDNYGHSNVINFYRPTNKDIDVLITVKMLTGYTTATRDAIKASIKAFLDSLYIGQDLPNSSLWAAALQATSLSAPTFSITALTDCFHSGSPGTATLVVAYNEVCRGNLSYITITET